MTPNAPAHAKGGVLDLTASFDPELPTEPITDELEAYRAELAENEDRPAEWEDAFAGPIEDQREAAEAEKLTAEEAAIWLSELRDRRRAQGLRVGGKSLSYHFRERWGYPINPGNEGRTVTLADRGDLIRVEAGLRKTDEEIFSETLRDLDMARDFATRGGLLAETKEQPKAMIEAADVLRVTSMEKAKLFGVIRQVQKNQTDLNVKGQIDQIIHAPGLEAALAVVASRNDETRQQIESHRVPAAITAGDYLDVDSDDIEDAELEDES